jgi:hypothetical protein
MTLVKGDPQAGALVHPQQALRRRGPGGQPAGQTVTGGRINAGNSMQLIMNNCGTCPAPYNVSVQAVDITPRWSLGAVVGRYRSSICATGR